MLTLPVELNQKLEKDVENYETNAKLCIKANDGFIKKSETLLSNTQASGSSDTEQYCRCWTFRPQSNLEPTYLDKEANHLEVSKFCQNYRTVINVGFRGAEPVNVQTYISPFSWWSSLQNRKVKEKGLEEIIADILEESFIINPVHTKIMDPLKEKKPNSSYSDFLIRLEEKFNLIQ